VDEVAQRVLPVVLVGLLLGGCADRSPARVTGPGTAPVGYRTYRLGQQWDEPPGWRVAVTGIRCGATESLAPGDTDADHVCLVTVTFTNETAQARPFTGTADEPGPTWRVSAYDADGDEFHGHARPVGPTAPGGTGSTDLVFEVPQGPPVRRVLLAEGMVDLS
jgi:hypothetical protein